MAGGDGSSVADGGSRNESQNPRAKIETSGEEAKTRGELKPGRPARGKQAGAALADDPR